MNFIILADFIILNIRTKKYILVSSEGLFLTIGHTPIDFENSPFILRMEDRQQFFSIDTLPNQSAYLDECKRIDHQENDDYGSHRYKKESVDMWEQLKTIMNFKVLRTIVSQEIFARASVACLKIHFSSHYK